MSDSEKYVFLTLRRILNVKAEQFGNSVGPSTARDFCVRCPMSHIASQAVLR